MGSSKNDGQYFDMIHRKAGSIVSFRFKKGFSLFVLFTFLFLQFICFPLFHFSFFHFFIFSYTVRRCTATVSASVADTASYVTLSSTADIG